MIARTTTTSSHRKRGSSTPAIENTNGKDEKKTSIPCSSSSSCSCACHVIIVGQLINNIPAKQIQFTSNSEIKNNEEFIAIPLIEYNPCVSLR
ncbi:unnamed protein product [Rotaria magnacalcarata]|uniref:Uncharacterized protein n=1 Tax=Rotaria magnacalcarata TaxID=392030 RepID=A0A815GE30_9BILA|nr:unnamed protein product [Rotaria magnacalcarata]CAF1438284.1 unnamed protein product [Rotaria magnacalcarata]CAF1992868.1 unnamed protein product [Rotaria magnacalcarata]CAF1997684.1 unnamed protein product [Rotaria magnacalcarata]CAF3764057.1 unnamed protein product [Rotaria magnacalcarata]